MSVGALGKPSRRFCAEVKRNPLWPMLWDGRRFAGGHWRMYLRPSRTLSRLPTGLPPPSGRCSNPIVRI